MNAPSIADLRVAVVHEWLERYAGSERVLEQMLAVLPGADLFALVDFVPAEKRGFLGGKPVRTSYIQKLPFARRLFRKYLPLMPHAVEQFDLSGYDLVISSSHAVAKGVLTAPEQLHLCMCYSPMRYAWDLYHDYLRGAGLTGVLKGAPARWTLHYLRMWDVRTANGVDRFIAISRFIAGRIWKLYRRRSAVIYPPVNTEAFTPQGRKEDFYLAASRMAPYKRMDLIVEAFSRMPDRRLVVIGDGPDLAKCRAKAGANVKLLGYQPFDVLADHMRRARAFVFAAKEDFGIVAVEAQACGTPVIAYGVGGSAETVLDGKTGILFPRQTPQDIARAVEQFESRAGEFDPAVLRAHAETFSPERFRREFRQFVEQQWEQFHKRQHASNGA